MRRENWWRLFVLAFAMVLDSLALVDILLKLEEVTNLRIPAGKVGAKDMDTIDLMFATAARVGKPRKK